MFRKIINKISAHRWRDLTGLCLLSLFIAAFLCARFCIGTVITVSGSSMYPTLEDGDFVYGIIVRDSTVLKTGDIVTVQDGDRMLIKRLRGVPGETIGDTEEEAAIGIPLMTLGEDEYFFVGDNYDNSYDSRKMGAVSREDIMFKCIGVRWNILELFLMYVLPLILGLMALGWVAIPENEISRYRFLPAAQSDAPEAPQQENDSAPKPIELHAGKEALL